MNMKTVSVFIHKSGLSFTHQNCLRFPMSHILFHLLENKGTNNIYLPFHSSFLTSSSWMASCSLPRASLYRQTQTIRVTTPTLMNACHQNHLIFMVGIRFIGSMISSRGTQKIKT